MTRFPLSLPVVLCLTLGVMSTLGACSGGRDGRGAPRVSPAEDLSQGPAPPAPSGPAAPDEPAEEPATEAEARVLLAERFRAAGLRVRHDVHVARPGAFELTVDGYDPEKRVGFEYIAVEERGADLQDAERAALARDPDHRILVLDAMPAQRIVDAADQFLRELGR